MIVKLGRECFLGSLNMTEHKSLSCVFQDPNGFDLHFFRDTRLYSKHVEMMLNICRECQKSLERSGNIGNTIYKKLMQMLEIAVEQGHGVVAICD